MTAANHKAAFVTNSLLATATDTITVDTMTGVSGVVASSAIEVFTLTNTDTGVSVSGLTTADTIALGGANTVSAMKYWLYLLGDSLAHTVVFDTATALGVHLA